MAILNGKIIGFVGLNFHQIGERILEGSPAGNGKGIILVLTPREELAFESVGGLTVGYSIVDLVADAVQKKKGEKPKALKYVYANRKFTT